MNASIASFFSALLFGLGLGAAGMTKPSKVIGFLDVAGAWDPSLALVMGSALTVFVVLFRLFSRRTSPLFEGEFRLPTRTDIDPKLVGGAALFGVGWGLGGFCPGPGLVSFGAGLAPAAVFVACMVAGIKLHELLLGRRAS